MPTPHFDGDPTNNQQVFDYVLDFIRQQGQPAISGKSLACRFRTEDGLCCAAGSLIPDDKYTPKLEEYGIDQISYFAEHRFDFNLLSQLQEAHDSACHESLRVGANFETVFDSKMQVVAEEFGLEYAAA